MNKLLPSKELTSIINKYKPLNKKQVQELIDDLKNTKNRREQENIKGKIINSLSKMFANIIYKNNSRFLTAIPHATFDDIFNQMVLMVLKNIDNYDPKKSQLTTWSYWEITPLIKTPHLILGDKIQGAYRKVDIDKKTGEEDFTIGDMMRDTSIDIQNEYQSGKKHRELMKAIKKLKSWEQQLILNYFGFKDDPKFKDKFGKVTYASMGRALGWSKQRMAYNIQRMLELIKKQLKQNKINLKQLITKQISNY